MQAHHGEGPQPSESSTPRSPLRKAGWIALLLLVTAVIFVAVRPHLTLEQLASHEATFQQWKSQHFALTCLSAFAIYVLISGLSLPGAAGLTLAIAWLFGFWTALVLVSFASTTGATVAFLISRYLLRDMVTSRFGERLQAFNESLRVEGGWYLLTLRLLPAVPFFIINAVMGLTPIPARTFWWVSQLGMLPGTLLYVWAGSRVPDLQELAEHGIRSVFSASRITQIVVAFVLLSVLPLALRWSLKRFRRMSASQNADKTSQGRN